MKLKTVVAAAVMLAAGIELFAVKLPDGKNVRTDEVTSYKSGAVKSVKLREDTEITTPIGTVMAFAAEKVYYYENGTVKSIVLSNHEINKNLKIVTNFAEADGSTGVINGLAKNKNTVLTFYENGALWRIDGVSSFLVKTPNGAIPLAYDLLFYESDATQPPIIHKAMIGNDSTGPRLPAEITLKAGTFTLKDSTYTGIRSVEGLRYGMDRYDISFYKSGAIKKLGIGKETAKDCTLTTSLGEVFAEKTGTFPLMFWEDGSLKQCTVDDVLQVEIYGKKVQIPVGGLLRFRRDGSVWAYTTDQKISYKIGKETYTANDSDASVLSISGGYLMDGSDYGYTKKPFNTVVLDEKGTAEQFLNSKSSSDEFLAQSFYPSGRVKKCTNGYGYGNGVGFILENKKGFAYIDNEDNKIGLLVAAPQGRDHSYYTSSKLYYASIAPNVYMLYFADNGFPSSYEVIQPISGIPLTLDNLKELSEEYRFGDSGSLNKSLTFFLQMTEDDEFIVSKERIRNLKFTDSWY